MRLDWDGAVSGDVVGEEAINHGTTLITSSPTVAHNSSLNPLPFDSFCLFNPSRLVLMYNTSWCRMKGGRTQDIKSHDHWCRGTYIWCAAWIPAGESWCPTNDFLPIWIWTIWVRMKYIVFIGWFVSIRIYSLVNMMMDSFIFVFSSGYISNPPHQGDNRSDKRTCW